mgnify:CR=1 FL=1
MPPIQCVMLRQKSIDLERDSTLLRIDAPVVVKPDVVSKRIFTNPFISPLKRYGSVPVSMRITQLAMTLRYPSLIVTFSFIESRDRKNTGIKETRVTAIESRKGLTDSE